MPCEWPVLSFLLSDWMTAPSSKHQLENSPQLRLVYSYRLQSDTGQQSLNGNRSIKVVIKKVFLVELFSLSRKPAINRNTENRDKNEFEILR